MKSKDNKQPTIEQWAELYKIAKNIRTLSPWDYLWESNFFTIMLPGHEEPIFCSIMGQAGECYAIGIYPGYKSILSFYRLNEYAEDFTAISAGFEQDCLMCFFGDREEVMPEDRKVYKALDIRFRGRNEWIYFRAMDPGYLPWHINTEQCDLLIQVMQNLQIALENYINNEITVDFNNNEMVLRSYSPENEVWINSAEKIPPIPEEVQKIIINNDLLPAQMKKRKCNGVRLELEAAYVPTPIRENKKDRPYLPTLILMADKGDSIIVGQRLLSNNDDISISILDMLADYMKEYGKPISINVRDSRIGRHIEDLCQKTGIKLIEKEGIPTIDGMMMQMLGFMDAIF